MRVYKGEIKVMGLERAVSHLSAMYRGIVSMLREGVNQMGGNRFKGM